MAQARPNPRTPDDALSQDLKLVPAAKGFRSPAKKTCNGCPWRKDAVPGALGGWTPTMYLEAAFGPADIACHMSKHFDGHVATHHDPDADRPRSCAGLAAFRRNMGLIPGHPCGSAAHAVAETTLEASREAFDNPNAFLLHHENPEGRAARFWRPDRAGCGTRTRSGSGEGER